MFDNTLIKWDTLKKDFKAGKIQETGMRAIGGLRKCTLKYLFKKLRIGKMCYTEIGSDTPTSDLDFTYVSYHNPSLVLERMIEFYNIYGNFPDVTFDTNFSQMCREWYS